MIQEEMEFATQVPRISVGVRSLPPSLYLTLLVSWQPLDFINLKDVTDSTVPIMSLLFGYLYFILLFIYNVCLLIANITTLCDFSSQ